MDEIISGSLFFGLTLTFGAYLVGCAVHRKVKTPLLNPLITTNVIVIAFLAFSGVSYESYNMGARYIGDLLTPATVCLAIPLYRQLRLLRSNARAICCGGGRQHRQRVRRRPARGAGTLRLRDAAA